MRATDLLILADAYRAATGERMTPISAMATGADSTFRRIARGRSVQMRTAERAFDWFDANWPPGVPWPTTVPRPCCREAAE
jgi:hypothetical protein